MIAAITQNSTVKKTGNPPDFFTAAASPVFRIEGSVLTVVDGGLLGTFGFGLVFLSVVAFLVEAAVDLLAGFGFGVSVFGFAGVFVVT